MTRRKIITFILVVSGIAVLFMPLFTTFYLHPLFKDFIVSDEETTASEIANHFVHYFAIPDDSIQKEDITIDVIDEVNEMHQDFGCEKVKIFSTSGEILYSTEPADIGKVNSKDYFTTVISQGTNFSKLVKKNHKTAEGRIVDKDVFEIYSPLVFNGRVAGATEIYFDVTAELAELDNLIKRSTLLIMAATMLLLGVIFISLYWLNKSMLARDEAELELSLHRDQLEDLVEERTEELRDANIRLHEDIEKRHRAEMALRESEGKYRGLIETASDAIFVIDADSGTIIDVNRKGQELIGRRADELIGMHHTQLHPSDETEKYFNLFKDFISQTSPPDISYHVIHADGYRIPVEISTSFMEYGQTRIIQGIFRDIRDRVQMEEEIQKAQRLESAGMLAGGIAHDFNNLLTAILGNISLAKNLAKPGDEIHARLLETENATIRTKDLTQQLLTFAKGGVPITRTVDVSGIIVESAEFVLRGSKLKCEFNIADDLWPIEADQGQINQVIQNIVINASQVMPEGGTCTITAENVMIKDPPPLPLSKGRYIKISIHDEGIGIPPHHLDKIFDPYFTTKTTGTGLGLPTAYSIVSKHDGLLTVESEISKGTTFYIYLPASDNPVLPLPDIDEEFVEIQSGEGHILLMDDEEFIREIASQLLAHLGYTVDTATEGREALEMFRKRMEQGEPYTAVIMDLTVPGGMGGKDTVLELKKIDPDVKTIVSSGYANDPILANYREYGFDGMVPKPYKVEELAETLHKVVTGSG